ncbi:alpha/beta hydrolase [Porphyromonas sp.]|uniref:alpha/beta hydrolase n=1 Tax=Porphyromonas sp. TaxID=1924944 RepID=UPI0026DD73FE|nr:alpha/beta hydrolase [Porphyromonas sp.]MDO4695878.1 alpha/beta hydrolase [Porphyromonas sp.]MDO4771475.1 alpha/beta hydrolase [Porphyromonas sp.]
MELKKIFKIVGIIILLLLITLTGIGWFLLDFSLKPPHRGKDIPASYIEMRKKYPTLSTWLDSLNNISALKDTFITADDGTTLHGYYVHAAAPTAKTAVIIHGYTDNAVRMMMIGEVYHRHLHYNVLLPDLRNAGYSDGKYIQMGWKDRLDIVKWMDIVPTLFGDSARVVVHGISMGAATTMMYSGEELPERVKVFVPDCGYTTVWDQFAYRLKIEFGLPTFPILYAADIVCRWRYGWNFKEASALSQVAKCDRPMFFIHGDADDYVPTAMVYDLYKAKQGIKDLWIAPGSAHAVAYLNHPQEYTARLKAFIEPHMK